MKLLPNEKMLVTSDNNKLALTNQRISLTENAWGGGYFISIFLENISSIEKKFKTDTVFLLIGCFALFFGYVFFTNGEERDHGTATVISSLGIICLIFWVISWKYVVTISSNGGASLNFVVNGIKRERVDDFLDKLSLAQAERMKSLNKL